LNILYLIGNGFDLNLGLKTKLSYIVEKIIEEETDDADILKLKENLKEHKDLWWSDFELQLGKHTKEFSFETMATFDNQYSYFIKKIIDLFKKQENRIDYKNKESFIAQSFMRYIATFYNYLSDTSKQILLNILKKTDENEKTFYDFITFNYTSVLDKFIDCSLKEYFNNAYSTPNLKNSQKLMFHFIRKIIHIHGTLEDGLILGVDNAGQIANRQLADNESFLPRLVKLETIKALGRNSANEARELIDNSNIIIAFGLSIGITDKYWWNYIISWLNKNTDRQFLLFVYDDKMDSTLNLTKLNTIKNAKAKLFSVLDSSVQAKYNACNDRIHYIFEQKDMFKIEDIFFLTNKESSYSNNRFNTLQLIKDYAPAMAIASKALENIPPDALKNFSDIIKKLPP
jgi:hypothetical protein